MLKTLKKALGFSGETPDDDSSDSYTPYDDTAARKPYVNPFKKEETPEATARPASGEAANIPMPPISHKQGLPTEFLDIVAGIINENLPPIIKDNINIDAQKSALAKIIEPHFKEMLDNAHNDALAEAQRAWDTNVKAINDKISKLTASAADNERRANETRQKLNVEEAKRRALQDKVREQEGRITTLEAEHDQYVIENKGLLNKIKVLQLDNDKAEKYREQADDQENLIKTLNAKLDEANRNAQQAADEINKTKQELARATAQLEKTSEYETQLQQAQAVYDQNILQIEELKNQNELMAKDLDQAKAQAQSKAEAVSKLDSDIKSLKEAQASEINKLKATHASEVRRLQEENNSAIESLNSQHSADIAAITAERDDALAQLESEKTARKDEAAEHSKEIKFLKAQHKRDEAELKAEIKGLKERKPTIDLTSPIDSDLRDAVKQTLGFDPATPEPAPQPANDLFGDKANADIEDIFNPGDNKGGKSASAAEVDVLDDLDDLDWVMPVATPTATPDAQPASSGAPAPSTSRKRDKKKTDDNQLSLF